MTERQIHGGKPDTDEGIRSMALARELREGTREPAAAAKLGHLDLEIGGMTCAHCPPLLEKALMRVDGVGPRTSISRRSG
jgi:hypothetical protein